MKECVAFFICIVLISPFMSQYTVQAVNSSRMSRVETIVNTAKEQARQEGCFTPEITARMVSDIEKAGVDQGDITVDVTPSPKYRADTFDERELIHYEVGIKIDKKIAANKMFGIPDEENQGVFTVQGAVASEKLLP